jgi:hypothetical protein
MKLLSQKKMKGDILYAIDLDGIAIVNKKSGTHAFIKYPEAAVWSVLIENHGMKKSNQLLQAILGKNKTETNRYIKRCLNKWKDLNIFYQDGKFINYECMQ